MDKASRLFLSLLVNPPRDLCLRDDEWNQVLLLARHTGLAPRLAVRLLATETWLPARVREQLKAARGIADFQRRSVRWEINRVERTLAGVGSQVVWLKGAAYLLADLPVAQGRTMGDLDILVPRERLAAVEKTLRAHGWEPLTQNDYDDRYYREWMHELPPLRHGVRGSVIDVHHTILPLTGRCHPDPTLLLAAARGLPASHCSVLSSVDMVLHAAAHMFQDGDMSSGVRDLLDFDSLVRHFGACDAGFWRELVPRARQLHLARPLYYSLRAARSVLGTPVPAAILADVARDGPQRLLRAMIDVLVGMSLPPRACAGVPWSVSMARAMLYIRSHWLKMPPGLLLRHLTHKWLRQWAKPSSPRA